MEQGGGVDDLLVGLREPRRGGHLAGVTGDRGAVAGGHSIPEVEGAQERAEQRHLEFGELLGPHLELVGALLREQQGADHVLEGEQRDREQGDRGEADLDVKVGRPDREEGRGQLGREQRHERTPDFGRESAPLHVGGVAGDQGEVDQEGDDEHAEDEQIEDVIRLACPRGALRGVEGDSGEQGEPGVGDHVDQQVGPGVARARPTREDRGHADQRRRGPAQEHGRRDDRQEARRDLDPDGRRVDRREIAHDRRREQDTEQRQVPVRRRVACDRNRHRRRERHQLEGDHSPGRTSGHQRP